MTRPRKLIVASVAAAALAVTLVASALYWPVYGRLKGEPFYQEMPASYWRREVAASDIILVYLPSNSLQVSPGARPVIVCPRSPRLDDIRNRVNRLAGWPDDYGDVLRFDLDDNPVPVLTVLLHDTDPKVRGYAAGQLGSLGAAAGAVLTELGRLVDDDEIVVEDCTVGAVAREALRRIGSAPD